MTGTNDEEKPLHAEAQRFMATILAMYTEHQLEMVAKCFYFLDPKIRERRLRAIMDLSVERDRLLQEYAVSFRPGGPRGMFASAFMERGIEHLIQGDVREVRAYADMYLFEGEGDDLKSEWVPIYDKFRSMLLAAIEDPEALQ